MTTTQDAAEHAVRSEETQSRSRGDIAVGFAQQMAHEGFSRGELAALRRMDPDEPDTAVFWRLLAREGLLNFGHGAESKWALILHGIALMTPTGVGDSSVRTAHDGYMPVGRALFLGGDAQRTTGFYSETRFNRLLTARGPMLRTLLTRMFRMLASAGVSFNWREMAQFIMHDGDQEMAEEGRRRIARHYYQAERRYAQASGEETS